LEKNIFKPCRTLILETIVRAGRSLSTSLFIDLINYPNEERHLEFKKSASWGENRFKAKITKSILGMANIRDGGWILIGKEEQPDGTFIATGMNQSDFDSFNSDVVRDFVKDYADPYVNLSVHKIVHAQKKFVIIRIEEFDTIPVICKRDWGNILHRGKIYTRSKGKPETIEVPGQTEMREIINMAVEKEIRHFYERISHAGLQVRARSFISSEPSDKELFDKQREDLL